MHVLETPQTIEPRFASYDIEEQLKRCGVGPGLSGYPRVSKNLQIVHEVKYDASGESGWCFTEFENVEPRQLPGESDHIVAFSRFKRTKPDELLQATFMVVADEKHVEHIRDVMIATAKSFKVNWENTERYYPRGKVVPVKRDPLLTIE